MSARAGVLPVAGLALALGGCAMDRVSEIMPKASDWNPFSFELNPYSGASSVAPSTFQAKPVTAADYVNPDGSCAGASAETAADPGTVPAVALQMSECAIVQALGAPQKVEIGSNERGERLARILYSGGARPGLYSFTAGRLTLVERVAEPAPPPKAQRQQKPKPPAQPRRAAG